MASMDPLESLHGSLGGPWIPCGPMDPPVKNLLSMDVDKLALFERYKIKPR